MEVKIGYFTFFSNFDSGNLARVERVKRDINGEVQPIQLASSLTLQEQNSSGSILSAVSLNMPTPDFEFNLWTSPDCAGSPHENLNRTWFYFGVKGGQAGKLMKFNLMNLNKQGKLYNQGMTPLVKVLPCRNKWERIRERPFCEVVDGQFQLSFVYRFPDQRNITCYFAFCYPYSYEDTQTYLQGLDCKLCHDNPHGIYYHRELLCKSIDGLRVDLLTVTSFTGMLQDREARLQGLFPDKETPRANRFQGKKVFVLTSRVHPGETPASYVFKGFSDFITRTHDPRAAALRDRFVFKLVPLLNPDGVRRGHYRTDQRGVNLNRVYLEPCPELHPSIYAAKAIVAYHHDRALTLRTKKNGEDQSVSESSTGDGTSVFGVCQGCREHHREMSSDAAARVEDASSAVLPAAVVQGPRDGMEQVGGSIIGGESEERRAQGSLGLRTTQENYGECDRACVDVTKTRGDDESCASSAEKDVNNEECKGNGSAYSEGSNSACDVAQDSGEHTPDGESPDACVSENDGAPQESLLRTAKASDVDCEMTHGGAKANEDKTILPALVQKVCVRTTDVIVASTDGTSTAADQNPTDEAELGKSDGVGFGTQWVSRGGLGFYVDLHGHASKRGCFMYGNHIEEEEKYVQCLLFPKLISLNSAHFDFTACNFSEKNMYSRDKRDGMSKEGSGRVAMYKMTGLPHCYTLECNYNCGRSTNAVPPATCDDGRATPPPPPGFPPRYTPEIYEEVGRAVAISALDMVNANPWSRLPTSEHGCVEGVRSWVSRYVRSNKNSPAIQKKTQRVTAKTSSSVTQTGPMTHRGLHKICSTGNDLIPPGGNDIAGGVKNLDRIVKQRSLHNITDNKKSQSSIYASCRNQVSIRTKDQGRKRLDVAKTTPLLMLSNGDSNATKLRLERNDMKHVNDYASILSLERKKSSVIKKLRDNLTANLRLEGKVKNADVNDNYNCESERKKTKLRNTIIVKQLDCTNSVSVTDTKSEMFSTSELKEEVCSKESCSKILKRPLMPRRRKSRRTIRQDQSANKITREVVDVKSLQGHEVVRKNSSQVSL